MDNAVLNRIEHLSEEYYADLFEYYLKYNAYDELPFFDNILREIPCKQGIADFICYKDTNFLKKHFNQIKKLNNILGKTFTPVISTLLKQDKQDINDLSIHTGYTEQRLLRIIKILLEEHIIKVNKLKQYSLYASWKDFDVELWAFELKLKNWKRALYQATQYQSFTNNVFTVFPMDKEKLLLSNIEYFKNLNVGCIVLDDYEMNIKILYTPKKYETCYNSPYLYTLTESIANL